MFDYLTRPEKCDDPIDRSSGSNENEEVWLGRRSEEEEDASEVCSPPLWKTSNTQQRVIKYNQLSPAAKARAVVRAQQELMEMVDKMPESSYELSLKDIVEHNHRRPYGRLEENAPIYNNKNHVSLFTEEVRKRNIYGIMERSRSIDNGKFLLKMILPFDFRSKSKKQVVLNESKQGCSKVSPRPSSAGSSDIGSSRFGDPASIRRTIKSDGGRFVSSTSSSRSSSSSRQSGGIFLTGCWSVMSFKKKVFED